MTEQLRITVLTDNYVAPCWFGSSRRRCSQPQALCHCPGMAAHAYLRGRFGALVLDAGAGSRWEIG